MKLDELKRNKAKFFPEMNEKYSFVDMYGRVMTIRNQDDLTNHWLFKHYPIFRTEKEAEDYLDYLDVLFKYSHEFSKDEWQNENIEKWYIWMPAESSFEISSTKTAKYPNCIYFKSYFVARNFIIEAGAENIKKFMFDVWD